MVQKLKCCLGHVHPILEYLGGVPALLLIQLHANAYTGRQQLMAPVAEVLPPTLEIWLLDLA